MNEPLTPETRTKASMVARCCDDQKAAGIVVLDMTGVCGFTDAFVVATCNSTTHLRGLAQRIERLLRNAGHRPIHTSGADASNWTVLDYADLVVHLFTAEGRDYYRLENLWDKATPIDWRDEAADIEMPDEAKEKDPQ